MSEASPSRRVEPGPDLREHLPSHGVHVRLLRLDLPLEEPFSISFDTFTETPSFLAEATDGDRTGVGEGAPIASITGESREDAAAAVEDWTPHPSLISDIGSPAARTAIEGALLDLAARREGLPLARFLGATGLEPVPTSVTLPLGGDDLAARVRELQEDGVEIIKVKAGDDVQEDLDRLRRVREAAGPGPALRVDPNQGWTRKEALEALDGLEDLDVTLLEQPLETGDLEGNALLREHTTIPIALDEDVFGADDVRQAIDAEAADVVNIKLMKAGGLLEGLAAAELAGSAGLEAMLGCMIESRVGIGLAAHLYQAHDAFTRADLDGPLFLEADPVTGGPRLRDGAVRTPDEPGLGVETVDAGETLATLDLP